MKRHSDATAPRLARLLGWGSLGLGAAQLAAPRAVCRLVGVDDAPAARALVPAAGARELLHAASLLGSRSPGPWLWGRVAGDAADLGALGAALATRDGRRRQRAAIATAVVAAVTCLDVYAAVRARRGSGEGGEGAEGRQEAGARPRYLHAAITVGRPRHEVYAYWRDFTHLPDFMAHLESVEAADEDGTRTHWRARGPARRTIEWDAEITEDRPDELIAWQSARKARVRNAGSVIFADAPDGRGTELHVRMRFEPPAGKAGAALARLTGEHPEQQVRDDLRRFKQVLETGEVVRSESSPEGTRAMRQARQRPAQPLPAR